MGRELQHGFLPAREVFAEVSESTGISLEKLCFESDEETLRRTENAQLALFAVEMAAFRALTGAARERGLGGVVHAVAGHSVGEFAALAASGVYRLEDAAKLVQARGETMAAAGSERPGAMAAVLGLDSEELERLCAESDGVVVVANDNCPGQVVISGEVDAVAELGKRAIEAGAKRVLPLNVSGAFHSPLMEESARRMRKVFDSYPTADAKTRIYSNVTAEDERQGIVWPELLENQLRSRVRWTETILNMRRDGVDTFIECGVGEVLGGLIRRIDKTARVLRVNDPVTLEETLAALSN